MVNGTVPQLPGQSDLVDAGSGSAQPAAPRGVRLASWLLVLAAAVQLLASGMAVAYATSAEHLVAIQAQIAAMSGSTSSAESMRNMGVITVVLAGLGTVSAYLLFAFFVRKGRSWARLATGVLMLLTLTQLAGISFPTGLTTVAQIMLGGLAVCCCYLPSSKNYFTVVGTSRG